MIPRPITRPIVRPLSSPLSHGSLPWEQSGSGMKPSWDPTLLGPAGLWRTDPWQVTLLDVTGVVSQWADQSGNARHLVKAAAGTAPTCNWQSSFDGEIAVDFTFTPSLRALFTTIPQPFTVAVVCIADRTTAQVIFDSANAATNAFCWINGAAPSRFEMRAGATLAGTVTTAATATKYLVVCEFNGASSKMWVNGALEASGNAGTNGLADGFTLGASRTATPGTPFDGRMPFATIVPRVLTTDERNALGKYVSQWYGITVAGAAVPPGFAAVTPAPTWRIAVQAGQSNRNASHAIALSTKAPSYLTQYSIPISYSTQGNVAGPTFVHEQAANMWGPEVAWAARAISGQQRIAIVKVSQGATHLAAGAGSDWSPASSAELYDTLVSRATTLVSGYARSSVDWFSWSQGEADATVEAEANAYQTNLADLISNLRTDLSASGMRAQIVRLHTDWDGTSYTLAYHATVRAAQTAAVAADGNASLTNQDDLGLTVGDEIHVDDDATLTIGERECDDAGVG